MIKQTIFVIAVFLVSLAFARYIENDRAPVDNQEASLKDLKDRLILLELEKLSETPYYNNKYNKRSDIDSRLLEWQAKIKQLHHLNDRLPGHGKIDFEDIGKRK